MKCSIQGCPGEYVNKTIVHAVKHGDEVLVFENVPAEVCNVCSDILLTPETVRRLEKLVDSKTTPGRFAPVYDCA